VQSAAEAEKAKKQKDGVGERKNVFEISQHHEQREERNQKTAAENGADQLEHRL